MVRMTDRPHLLGLANGQPCIKPRNTTASFNRLRKRMYPAGGVSTTKPSPPLRSSSAIRKADDEAEAEPGRAFSSTVAHRGPTLKGEFARTVNRLITIEGVVGL